MPPSLAIAIAILLSVTVSIAAEDMGTLSFMFFVKLETIETSLGRTFEYDGIKRTSSYVKPSPIIFFWNAIYKFTVNFLKLGVLSRDNCSDRIMEVNLPALLFAFWRFGQTDQPSDRQTDQFIAG